MKLYDWYGKKLHVFLTLTLNGVHIQLYAPAILTPGSHWIGGWVEHGSSLDTAVENREVWSAATSKTPVIHHFTD
jgi:hypothetical protein